MPTIVIGLYKTRCECGAVAKDAKCPNCGPFTAARRDPSGGTWLDSDEREYQNLLKHFGLTA